MTEAAAAAIAGNSELNARIKRGDTLSVTPLFFMFFLEKKRGSLNP
jgi:hypothetical protein